MRFSIIFSAVLLWASNLFATEISESADEKTLYAVGIAVSRSLAVFSLSPSELEIVKKGITDAVSGKKLEVSLSSYNDKVQELARNRRKSQGEKQALLGRDYLEKVSKEKGYLRSDSGIVYTLLKEGTGTSPKLTDTVKVNYRGALIDGTEFDSSFKRGKPTEFRLDGVIKCWSEMLQKMKPGGSSRVVCPSSLAYGDSGAGELILPGATLVFDVDLLEVKK
jgi:FKBP-type peptidyl-prolyl cis-trans isomerase FkpA